MTISPILLEVQQHFAAIHKASGEFIMQLSMAGIERDITLAAACAGLAMLRQSKADLASLPPGTAVLGAVADANGQAMMTFVMQYAAQSGLDPKSINIAGLTAEMKAYQPETIDYRLRLASVCEANQLPLTMHPYVAATTAVKLILAGKQLQAIEPGIGLALAVYHITAGCKTVPFPPSPADA